MLVSKIYESINPNIIFTKKPPILNTYPIEENSSLVYNFKWLTLKTLPYGLWGLRAIDMITHVSGMKIDLLEECYNRKIDKLDYIVEANMCLQEEASFPIKSTKDVPKLTILPEIPSRYINKGTKWRLASTREYKHNIKYDLIYDDVLLVDNPYKLMSSRMINKLFPVDDNLSMDEITSILNISDPPEKIKSVLLRKTNNGDTDLYYYIASQGIRYSKLNINVIKNKRLLSLFITLVQFGLYSMPLPSEAIEEIKSFGIELQYVLEYWDIKNITKLTLMYKYLLSPSHPFPKICMWNRWSDIQKKLIRLKYGIRDSESFNNRKTEDWYDLLIDSYPNISMESLGMASNNNEYFLENIYNYPNPKEEPSVLNEKNIRKFTDISILKNIPIHHFSRDYLLDISSKLLKEEKTFFIPLKCESINLIDATLESTRENFIIAHGKINSYTAHTIEELMGSISNYGTFIYEGFPSKLSLISENEILNLESLIEYILDSSLSYPSSLYELRDVITKHMIEKSTIIPHPKCDILNVLKIIFEIGMYQRRWIGPPSPYPMKKSDTLRLDFNLDEMMTIHYTRLEKELNEEIKNDIYPLRICKIIAGIEVPETDYGLDFKKYHSMVVSGDECVRVASSVYIATASYYARKFYNHTFEGYSASELDPIS